MANKKPALELTEIDYPYCCILCSEILSCNCDSTCSQKFKDIDNEKPKKKKKEEIVDIYINPLPLPYQPQKARGII